MSSIYSGCFVSTADVVFSPIPLGCVVLIDTILSAHDNYNYFREEEEEVCVVCASKTKSDNICFGTVGLPSSHGVIAPLL